MNVNLVGRTVTSVGVAGSTVVLTLSSPVVASDSVTVAYAADADPNPIRDLAGNSAADFTSISVTNSTGSGGGG